MAEQRGGSRFLYAPFEVAAAQIEGNARVQDERWLALERRLQQIETVLERQERRLWLAVYGAATLFAADRVYTLFSQISP